MLAGRPGAVLDLGCGTGILARRLVDLGEQVGRVDALDVSPAMVAEGQRLPNGDHPRLRWLLGRAEDAPLRPPYALATAAASPHWMDWQVVLSRLHDLLAPEGPLVTIVDANPPPPWQAELLPILQRYSTNQEYQPGFDLVRALQERGLFEIQERRRTAPISFRQSLDAYVESFHARNGFSRADGPRGGRGVRRRRAVAGLALRGIGGGARGDRRRRLGPARRVSGRARRGRIG